MANGRPRTDFGTLCIHAILVASFAMLLATGLRIAADHPNYTWLRALDPVLPSRELWYWHMLAAVGLMASLAGYGGYVVRAGLQSRIRLDGARVMAILRGGRTRWSALNVFAFWILMTALVVEVASGVVLFLSGGELIRTLHVGATWVCLSGVACHVILHAAFGGIHQVLRIFRPSTLTITTKPDLAELLAEQLIRQSAVAEPHGAREPLTERPVPNRGRVNAHPLATAFAVALTVSGLAFGTESFTRPVLKMARIAKTQAPILNGDLSEPIWNSTSPVWVVTTHGGDFAGTHESRVEIRAVHDNEYAYFAFVWDDPTRSLKHFPLVKHDDGWHLAATRSDLSNEDVYHEDKFAVLLTNSALPLIGAAVHLAKTPLQDRPASSTGRGLHYTTDGSVADVWQWRASHGGWTGHIDNCHFGGPAPSRQTGPGEIIRYAGGFAVDPGQSAYESNFDLTRFSDAPLMPRRLPRDIGATRGALGRISDATSESETEDARWWMGEKESAPYSKQADDVIPVGTVIPGVLVADRLPDRADAIRGRARWAAGRWVLELSRRLDTGSPFDVSIKNGTLMWVAAFDHSDKRHTRHLRPLRLELD